MPAGVIHSPDRFGAMQNGGQDPSLTPFARDDKEKGRKEQEHEGGKAK